MVGQAPVQMALDARFKAALALARLNVTEWAKQNGYSAGHVYECLKGTREGPCVDRMEAFIAKYLPPTSASVA